MMGDMQQHQQQESWTTGHFDATLLANSLRVGYIPAEHLVRCTHALVKLLVLDAEESESTSYYGGHSVSDGPSPSGSGGIMDIGGLGAAHPDSSGVNVMLVQDMGGVTVIVNDRYYNQLELAGVVELMRWAPSPWRALQIHLGPASADTPGIISYLSSMLSERNVSILNFSTFEADLILVQDYDLEKARDLLEDCGSGGIPALQQQMAEKRLGSRALSDGFGALSSMSALGTSLPQPPPRAGKLRSNSTSSEIISSAALAVVQTPLVLAIVKRAMLKQTMFALMKQLTRNIDAQLLQRNQVPSSTSGNDSAATSAELSPQYLQASMLEHDYLWAYFSTFEEVSLLIDERDLSEFPEDSLVVSGERWKAIRLVGKDIPFDETGIVKIMSSPYDLDIQLLNMSTYGTNVSLVHEEYVEMTVERLRDELNGKDTKVFGSYRRTTTSGAGSGSSIQRSAPMRLGVSQHSTRGLHSRTGSGLGMSVGMNVPQSFNSHSSSFHPHSNFNALASASPSSRSFQPRHAGRHSDLGQYGYSRPMPVMMEHTR
mmetsp:Transcript_17242/g.33839  ORF Transcript_17242/g.33839 Transcript_17242/m.33839 type:complete len:543 (-) Transcript_17242:410-2038(-)